MVVQLSLEVGTESRPTKAPEALTRGTYETAPDLIGLPRDVFWSGAPLDFDLVRLRERVRVGERVLIKGNADDVLHFDDPGEPIEWWPRMVDPSCLLQSREAWRRSGHRELTTFSSTQNQGALMVASEMGAHDTVVAAQHLTAERLDFNLETS